MDENRCGRSGAQPTHEVEVEVEVGAAEGSAVEVGAVEIWAELAATSARVVAAPLWRATDDELVTMLRVEAVAAAQRDAARLAVVRELDERGYARSEGAVTTASWLARELLVEPRTAAAQVKAARCLDPEGDLPTPAGVLAPQATGEPVLAATGRSLAAGAISRAHADAMTTLVRRLPHVGDRAQRADLLARAEQWLLEQCATFDPADVRRLGRQLRHVVDPDGDLRDERADAVIGVVTDNAFRHPGFELLWVACCEDVVLGEELTTSGSPSTEANDHFGQDLTHSDQLVECRREVGLHHQFRPVLVRVAHQDSQLAVRRK